MVIDEGLLKRFKALVAGQGQPDERDFAAALISLDRHTQQLFNEVSDLRGMIENLTVPTEG